MSLDHKSKGNPAWVKGKSANPSGRPKGSIAFKTLLKVAATLAGKKRHPVEELMRIADEAESATQSVIIVDPGCTSWKIGQIVSRLEWNLTMDTLKKKEDHNKPTAKPIPGSSGGRELAADIWRDLLRYCEPQKKAQEVAPEKPTTPEESKAAADAAMRYLQELENGTNGENTGTESSDSPSMGDGETQVSPETLPTQDIRSDQGE